MSRAELSVMIRCRPHEVFAFLPDFDTTPMWQATASEVERLGDGPVAVGSRFVDIGRFLGKSFISTFEVVELDALLCGAVVEEVDMGLRTTVVSRVQPSSGGVWLPNSGVRASGGTR